MYKLIDTSGKSVLNKEGEPFKYSEKWTADLAKKFLEAERKTRLKVVSA